MRLFSTASGVSRVTGSPDRGASSAAWSVGSTLTFARARRARSRSMARFLAMRVSHVHFFRVRRAGQNAHDDGVRESTVPVVEFCQRGFIAGGDALEEAEIDLRTAGFHG
jgi:hypothetical protein